MEMEDRTEQHQVKQQRLVSPQPTNQRTNQAKQGKKRNQMRDLIDDQEKKVELKSNKKPALVLKCTHMFDDKVNNSDHQKKPTNN